MSSAGSSMCVEFENDDKRTNMGDKKKAKEEKKEGKKEVAKNGSILRTLQHKKFKKDKPELEEHQSRDKPELEEHQSRDKSELEKRQSRDKKRVPRPSLAKHSSVDYRGDDPIKEFLANYSELVF